MAWMTAAAIAAPFVANAFGGGARRRARRDRLRAVAGLRAARPTGYLTDDDRRGAELTRGRLNESAGAHVGQQRSEVLQRYAQRGLAGSAASERSLGRLADLESIARQRAGETAEEQLYNVKTGREQYERQKEFAIFGAENQGIEQDERRRGLQSSTFMNSLLEFLPTIIGGLGGGGVTGTTMGQPGFRYPVGSGYDPSVTP